MSCSGNPHWRAIGSITDPFADAGNRPRRELQRAIQAYQPWICVEALPELHRSGGVEHARECEGEDSMRIAVVGAGGVGGGFGAALAKAGADVTFIARGAHLAAMKSEGLRVNSPRGDTHLVPTQATDNPAGIGKVDVVLFCVKLWDVESAGEHIKPMVGPGTAVIPLQNGIDAADRLLPILGREAVMGGVAQISASIVKPGVINQVGTFMRMIFGELDGRMTKRGQDLLALCQKAGFDVTLSDKILTELWMKFILLATNASITASTRQPIGKLRDDPDIRPVIIAAVKEVHAVARAKGVALPADAVDKVL